jgi:ADP-dependent NAD(P)H-hydrate dehydratase / NAD(P)H-hydrate epimerase
MALPIASYTSLQVRALDAHAIEVLGIPGYTLMKRAGEAALRHLRARYPLAHRIVIACGGGNNGGDGYVLARFAQAAGLTVTVLAVADPELLKNEARQAFEDFSVSGGRAQAFAPALLAEGEIVVDALLGTGLKGGVRPEYAAAIHAINASARPVFALDVPSGLDADAGVPLGEAVRADSTLTFGGLKTGLLVGDGPEFAGDVVFDDLELEPPEEEFAPRLTRIVQSEIPAAAPRTRAISAAC